MKKFLFTVLCLLGLASYALADTYTGTVTQTVWSDNGAKELGGITWTLATDGGYFGYDAIKGQQVGSSKKAATYVTLTTDGISGVITSVKVNTSGASKTGATVSVKVGDTTFGTTESLTNTATEYTFTGSSEGTVEISWAQSTSTAIYFKEIVIEYAGAVGTVAAPSITMAEGVYNTVQITCATEGATIHYVLNDGSLEEYTGPFAIPADKVSTVEAMAELGQDLSDAVTKTVYPNKVADIKTLKAIASPAKVLVDCKVTAIPGGNKNFFVTDGVTPIMIYSNTTEVENGTTFANMEGIYELYNGLPEFKSVTFGEAGTGTAIEPIVLTIDEVDPDFVCEYIRINGVEFNGTNQITDGTNTLTVYNNTLKAELPAAGTYDVIGFIGVYNGNVQLLPTEFISNGPVVDPDATELTCVVDFSEQTLDYGKGKTVEWTADNGLVFTTSATVSVHSNYPILSSGKLRLYKTSNNIITVTAPDGYYFVAFVGHSTDANIVTFTVNGNDYDIAADDNLVSYVFGNTIANSFSFNCNNEANTAKNYNFTEIELVVDKYAALAEKDLSDKDFALTDGKQFINAAKVDVASISYAREFTKIENWKPWYAPFEMNATDFAKVIVMTNATIEEGTVNLYYETVTGTMEANKPYIVKVKNESEVFEAATNTLYAAEEVVEDINGFTLTGTYAPYTFGEGYALAVSDGNFHPVKEGLTLKPFRFYLTIPANTTNAPIRIIVDGQGESGIESLINVVEEGVIYNLQGMPVEHPTTGVYIQNGKKIFVK